MLSTSCAGFGPDPSTHRREAANLQSREREDGAATQREEDGGPEGTREASGSYRTNWSVREPVSRHTKGSEPSRRENATIRNLRLLLQESLKEIGRVRQDGCGHLKRKRWVRKERRLCEAMLEISGQEMAKQIADKRGN
jgi:hypothetical protein